MKTNYIYILLLIFLSTGFVSCETEVPPYKQLTDSKEGAQVFIAKSRDGIHYLNTFSYETEEVTEEDTIKFNVGYGDLELPASDIKISLSENERVIDSLNAVREINGKDPYLPFPKDAYDINNISLVIPAGKEYSNFSALTYYPEKFDIDENYLLAISIDNASGYSINPSQSTMIFAVSEVNIPEPVFSFKIMSYGIGSGNDDMETLAASINTHNPDLLVIREIDKNTERSGPRDLPSILAPLIGMPNYVFANALNYQGGQYGLVVYSKFPIIESRTEMLPTSANEKGPLGIIRVQINENQELIFAGTHLNASDSRRATQTPVLVDIMSEYSETPVVLAGNFNGTPGVDKPYQLLDPQFTFPCSTCPPNFTADNPKTHSDFIMFKPAEMFKVIKYKVGSSAVGSHLPVILELQLLNNEE